MTQDDLIQAQDEQRTKRAFISFLSTALGTDQTLAGEDGMAVNQPRQYQTIGSGGAVGIEGAPRSNVQTPRPRPPLTGDVGAEPCGMFKDASEVVPAGVATCPPNVTAPDVIGILIAAVVVPP